ncbi:hypothetical protein H7F33_00745 [Pedobacter sp. PAMC26386]|nr:hypothetical protein H7F33_00745 [Pedobacter sp. PAMC26386]
MENLNLNNSNGIEKLSRNELKNVVGGDYAYCYNVCMSGFDSTKHSQSDTDAKVGACDKSCS